MTQQQSANSQPVLIEPVKPLTREQWQVVKALFEPIQEEESA